MLLNQYDSAYHYYQGAVALAHQLKNEFYERYILKQLHLHARLTGHPEQVKAYLRKVVDAYKTDFYNKACLFKEEGNKDSASFYFLKATKDPRISTRAMAFQNLSQLYRKEHPALAFVYVDSFQIYKDSFYALRQTDKIEQLTAQHLQQMSRQNPEEWRAMRQEIVGIETQTLIGQFQQTAWQKRINAIQKGNGKPFSEKEQEVFQKETLALFDEFVKRLQAEHPKITEADVLFCLLSLMDYPTGLIASCIGCKENALRTRKHRLKEKLSKCTFELFFHSVMNQQDTEAM